MQVPPVQTPALTALEALPLRLTPGQDLRPALEAWFQARQAAEGPGAAWVMAAVGSLDAARLRLANAEAALTVPGPLELVALSGTLSADGAHLHAAVADAQGRVTGGHLQAGSPVRTTLELVLGWTRAFRFSRRFDPATGYPELVITPGP